MTRALTGTALAWYAANRRDLAFRRTSDPWAVLVSEVMAQQTQAARAAAAWSSFITRYPTPAALSAAGPADVIRAWRGLGYNRRALALHRAARRMVAEHGGSVPDSLEALEALPGIGPYTARAVLAIAFGRPVAALDTNIRRVVARALLGVESRDAPRPRALQGLADDLVPTGRAGEWTHALMDIGATLCRKREPRCPACPLARECAFAARGRSGTGRAPDTVRAREHQPFQATNRWLRGRVVERLRDAPDGEWVVFSDPIGEHGPDRVRAAVAALAGQGLLEVDPDSPLRARLPA